jgi:hypothetical protein
VFDFVARFDQAQAGALEAIRHADSFLLFVGQLDGDHTVTVHVCCPAEMIAWARQLLDGIEEDTNG